MKILKNILKKILPQFVINKLKVLLGEHPYILKPFSLLNRARYKKELAQILAEAKEIKGIIIYPPTIDWSMPLFQRPQQMAMAFAKEGYLFFYCTNNLRYDKVKGFSKISKNLFVTNQITLLRDFEKPILFISWPFNRFFIDKFKGSKFIYDYIDDLDVFDASGRTRQEILENHNFLVKNSDLVVVSADKLLLDVNKLRKKDVLLIKNGVDLEHFLKINKVILKTEEEKIFESKKPIIGYYGAIAEWFDYKLLEKAAEERPEYEFVIIGPLDYDKTLRENKHLFEIKNIHFLGPKPYTELPYYLSKFTVATIPFLVNNITEATSPVKLFEYMAGGKPVVTTAMKECKNYKSVFIAKDSEDYLNKIDEAIKSVDDKKYLDLLQKEANENSWEKRVKLIAEKLNEG